MEITPSQKTQAPLMTKTELAERWKTSVRNIDRLVAKGRLSRLTLGERLVRFRMADIEAYESKNRSRTILEGLIGSAH